MFPVTLDGRRFDDAQALAVHLQKAAAGPSEHPQTHPAEGFIAARREPLKARALAAACEVLVRESTDPGALLLCAQIGGADHLPFYRAVIRRIHGMPPIPDAPGSSVATLCEELANALAAPAVVADPVIFEQALQALVQHGPVDALILLLDRHDPNGELPGVLGAALRGERGEVAHRSLKLAVWSVARRQPDALLALAPGLGELKPPNLSELIERIALANPDWWAHHATAFHRAAGRAGSP